MNVIMTLYYVIVSIKIFLEVQNEDYITLRNLVKGDLAPLSSQFFHFFFRILENDEYIILCNFNDPIAVLKSHPLPQLQEALPSRNIIFFLSAYLLKSLMASLKTTFSDKQKTSRAKFNEKQQNLDSYSTNGKQNFKQSKTCPINGA